MLWGIQGKAAGSFGLVQSAEKTLVAGGETQLRQSTQPVTFKRTQVPVGIVGVSGCSTICGMQAGAIYLYVKRWVTSQDWTGGGDIQVPGNVRLYV